MQQSKINLKCNCGSWNISTVHGYFSYYLCEDCGLCYQEHTMKLIRSIKKSFYIQGQKYTREFTIDEIKKIRTYNDLEKSIKYK